MNEFLELPAEEGPKVDYSLKHGPYKEYEDYTWPMYYQGLALPEKPKQNQSQCRGDFGQREVEENPWDVLAEYYEALS